MNDFSTPQAAAKSFTVALANGNAAAARNAIVDPAKYGDAIDSMASMATEMKNLAKASEDRFGNAGKVLADSSKLTEIGGDIDKADVTISGDTAKLSSKDSANSENPAAANQPVFLKKVGSDWKVDLDATDADGQIFRMVPKFKLSAELMRSVTGNINAGKYATVEEAKAARDGTR